jgi:hypothetical protein
MLSEPLEWLMAALVVILLLFLVVLFALWSVETALHIFTLITKP